MARRKASKVVDGFTTMKAAQRATASSKPKKKKAEGKKPAEEPKKTPARRRLPGRDLPG